MDRDAAALGWYEASKCDSRPWSRLSITERRAFGLPVPWTMWLPAAGLAGVVALVGILALRAFLPRPRAGPSAPGSPASED